MMASQVLDRLEFKYSVASKSQTDEELIKRVALGDVSAFNMILERYDKPIYCFIRKQMNGGENVEDVAQEVLMRVYKSANTFDITRKFSSWIYKIAFNEVKRYWKRNAWRQTYSLNAPVGGENGDSEYSEFIEDERIAPEANAEQQLFSRDLKACIERLPDEQKTVVLLKIYGELTFEEIADICECPLSTVLSRMRYAVNKLRRWLGVESAPAAALQRN